MTPRAREGTARQGFRPLFRPGTAHLKGRRTFRRSFRPGLHAFPPADGRGRRSVEEGVDQLPVGGAGVHGGTVAQRDAAGRVLEERQLVGRDHDGGARVGRGDEEVDERLLPGRVEPDERFVDERAPRTGGPARGRDAVFWRRPRLKRAGRSSARSERSSTSSRPSAESGHGPDVVERRRGSRCARRR